MEKVTHWWLWGLLKIQQSSPNSKCQLREMAGSIQAPPAERDFDSVHKANIFISVPSAEHKILSAVVEEVGAAGVQWGKPISAESCKHSWCPWHSR